jgi:hypothetical protein
MAEGGYAGRDDPMDSSLVAIRDSGVGFIIRSE